MTKNLAANRVIAKVSTLSFTLNSLCFWHEEISAEAVTDVWEAELKKLVTLASNASSISVQTYT
jgi:hypothetical protein